MKETCSPTRERILQTAGELFFRDGYRAVGVDTIVAESGVAKMTLYRHFPSKDALITAYLEATDQAFWEWFDQVAGPPEKPGRDRLLAFFDALEALVAAPSTLGCPFLNAVVDFPERVHPAHQAALENKQVMRQRLARLGQEAGAREPQRLADQLLLLVDGAMMAARVFGPNNPARGVAEAAATLIDAQLE